VLSETVVKERFEDFLVVYRLAYKFACLPCRIPQISQSGIGIKASGPVVVSSLFWSINYHLEFPFLAISSSRFRGMNPSGEA
jgi:hypothetical protein